MKIFINHEVVVEAMPASSLLKASGIAMAILIMSSAVLTAPSSAPINDYVATVRLAAGSVMCAGSLLLSKAIGETFLGNDGRRALKALYCASIASMGAGMCEAASAFMAMSIEIALLGIMALFSGAGLAMIWLYREAK
jgi:hypothetical protein